MFSIVGAAYLFIASGRPSSFYLNSNLVGIWQGQHKNILDFRPDGSGRSRNTSDPAKGVSIFYWRFNPETNTLTLIDSSEELVEKVDDLIFGAHAVDFRIELQPDVEMVIVNVRNGGLQRFTRTTDALLEKSP